jgi:hypothetical protein
MVWPIDVIPTLDPNSKRLAPAVCRPGVVAVVCSNSGNDLAVVKTDGGIDRPETSVGDVEHRTDD